MPTTTKQLPQNELVISYMALRKSVGFLGILLPVVLISGTYLIGYCTQLQPSISHYYYTIMGSYFVGSLCAVSLFLFSYRGYNRQDRITALLAAVCALIVAFCPTDKNISSLCEYIVIPKAIPVKDLHYTAAALLFGCFAYFSLFLFTKSSHINSQLTKQKKRRNKVYLVCGILIVACIVLIGVYHFVNNLQSRLAVYKPVLVLESIALVSFGTSWLVKGEAILGDK